MDPQKHCSMSNMWLIAMAEQLAERLDRHPYATTIKSKCLDAGEPINLMMHNDMGRETRPITHTQGTGSRTSTAGELSPGH